MKPLATTVVNMERSKIREVMDLAIEMKDVIHLVVGEPNFATPEHIVEAAAAAARQGFTKYTANAGLRSLREAVAAKLNADHGLHYTSDNVVVTPGGVASIASVMLTLADAGDEVLIPDPSWPNYESILVVRGARPVPYTLRIENGFRPDLSELERLVTPRTKAIMINSPGNPTGAVYPPELVGQLVEFARRHDLYVVSDEIYEKMIFEGRHQAAACFDTDGRVITISGASKAYAMTGWRVGWTVANLEVAQALTKLQEPMTSCVNAMAQKAAEAALLGPQDCVETMRTSYRRRRDLAVGIMKEYGIYRYSPEGAFYLMVDISGSGLDSVTLAKRLLREQKVSVAPGDAFGAAGAGLVRVSLATAEDQLVEGLHRLCRFVQTPAPAGR